MSKSKWINPKKKKKNNDRSLYKKQDCWNTKSTFVFLEFFLFPKKLFGIVMGFFHDHFSNDVARKKMKLHLCTKIAMILDRWLINNRNSNRRNDSLYILRGRSFTTFTRKGREVVGSANFPTLKEFLHECQRHTGRNCFNLFQISFSANTILCGGLSFFDFHLFY